MNIERELLFKVLEECSNYCEVTNKLIEEIEDALAKPEVLPLTDDEIELGRKTWCNKTCYDYGDGFDDGVKFAEDHHGIK